MANEENGFLKVLSLVGTLATAAVTVIGAVTNAGNEVQNFKKKTDDKPDA